MKINYWSEKQNDENKLLVENKIERFPSLFTHTNPSPYLFSPLSLTKGRMEKGRVVETETWCIVCDG